MAAGKMAHTLMKGIASAPEIVTVRESLSVHKML